MAAGKQHQGGGTGDGEERPPAAEAGPEPTAKPAEVPRVRACSFIVRSGYSAAASIGRHGAGAERSALH